MSTAIDNESQLIHDIMQTLGKYAAVYRTNAGSIRLSNGKRFRGMPKGFSDILCVLPGGRAAFIECKVGDNKLSPEQERFLEHMQALGCMSGVAYTVADALRICGLETLICGD